MGRRARRAWRRAWWACTWPMISASGATTVRCSGISRSSTMTEPSRKKLGKRNSRVIPGINTRRGTRLFSSNSSADRLQRGRTGTALGLGTGYILAAMVHPEESWGKDKDLAYWKMGHPKHHSNEDAGQCGVLDQPAIQSRRPVPLPLQFHAQWTARCRFRKSWPPRSGAQPMPSTPLGPIRR